MFEMKKLILAATIALVLSGCSSPTVQERIAKQQEQIEIKQTKNVQKQLENVPDWFLDYNQSDESGMYAVGTSFADDMQIALDDARTIALSELASKSSNLMSQQKALMQKKGLDGTTNKSSSLVTDEFTVRQNMAGYRIVKREVKQEGKFVRAYVMVFLPFSRDNEANTGTLTVDHAKLVDRVNKEIEPKFVPLAE
jgi:PBP1b-binding outer membrane lipoprotein LpoB